MKKLSLFIVAAILAACAHVCYAKEPVEFTSKFFKMIEAGRILDAYDQLFAGSQIPAQKPQAVEMLKKQTSNILSLYGKIVGLEKIREERIGESIIRLAYILKLETAPTIWEFYFYKPGDNWFLANITFNDQVQSLKEVE